MAVDRELTRIATDRARHLGYQRGRHTQHPRTSLVKIEGVDSTQDAKYDFGHGTRGRNPSVHGSSG